METGVFSLQKYSPILVVVVRVVIAAAVLELFRWHKHHLQALFEFDLATEIVGAKKSVLFCPEKLG